MGDREVKHHVDDQVVWFENILSAERLRKVVANLTAKVLLSSIPANVFRSFTHEAIEIKFVRTADICASLPHV